MTALLRWWKDLWFREEPTPQLDVLRVGLGLALLVNYGLLSGAVPELYGPHGWVTPELARLWSNSVWRWSPLFYVTSGWQLAVFHTVFLGACMAFTVGWQTRWVKWLVLAGHLAYVHRNPLISYGVDHVLACVLFLVCLGGGSPAWRFACLRLIQLQVAVIMFFSGIEKVRGDAWWHGYAVWMTLTNVEYTNIPIGWLAEHFWVVNALTHVTLIFEVAYPFLVWGRGRPFCVAGAVLLHAGMAAMMGLYLFSFVMIVVHLSFLRPEWLAAWARLPVPFRRLAMIRLPFVVFGVSALAMALVTPASAACPTDRPITCWDQTCETTVNRCACPREKPIRCRDGGCAAKAGEVCTPPPTAQEPARSPDLPKAPVRDTTPRTPQTPKAPQPPQGPGPQR